MNNFLYNQGMIKLTILHTNDIHGQVSQLTRIAALVRQRQTGADV
jgi:2',3'-cyclic-nucleotide 2'-phosphodiesterase (5'-nucleotidase family)